MYQSSSIPTFFRRERAVGELMRGLNRLKVAYLIYRTHRRSHLDQCPRVRWRTAGGLCRSSAGPYLYRSATVVRHSRWTRCYGKSSNSESPCETATWPAPADGPRYRATTRSRSTVRRTWQKTDPARRSLEPCDLPDVRLSSAQLTMPWCENLRTLLFEHLKTLPIQ
jgi:hypothetical protein